MFPSSVYCTWQQRVALKQWCGCWRSHIYPPYSALQQLHRQKERLHYSKPRPVNRPATWGACRLHTGFTRGERREDKGGRVRAGQGLGRKTRCRRSVWDRRSAAGTKEEGKRVCVQYRPYFYLFWMEEHGWVWDLLPICAAKTFVTQQTFRWRIDVDMKAATLKNCICIGQLVSAAYKWPQNLLLLV